MFTYNFFVLGKLTKKENGSIIPIDSSINNNKKALLTIIRQRGHYRGII